MNQGLYNGILGTCLGEMMPIMRWEKKGLCEKDIEGRVNGILEGMEDNEDMSFSDGVTGIAWAIEWMSQQGWLSGDTNEALGEMDDLVYRQITTTKSNVLSFNNGSLGRLYYLLQRLFNKRRKAHQYRYIFLEDCILLIIQDIEEKICISEDAFFKEHILLEDHKEPYVLSRMMFLIDKLNYIKMFSHPLENTLFKLLKIIGLLNDRRAYEEMNLKDLTSYGTLLHAAYAYCYNHYLGSHADTLSEHMDRVHGAIVGKIHDLSYLDVLFFFSKTVKMQSGKWDGYRRSYLDKLLDAAQENHAEPRIGPYLVEAMCEGEMTAFSLARDVLVI